MSANAIQTLGVGENGNKTLKQNENSGFFRSPRDHRGESRFFTFGAFVLVHRTKPSYRNQSLGGRALISWAAQGFLHLLSFSTVALGKEFPDLNYRVSTPLMRIQRSIKTTRKKKINKFINDKVAFFGTHLAGKMVCHWVMWYPSSS